MARTFDPATLRFDAAGLIPAVAQDEDGAVLMLAWMNEPRRSRARWRRGA